MTKLPFNSKLLYENLTDKTLEFVNVQCLRGMELVNDHLWVRNGKIISAADIFFKEKKQADVQIDCNGYILSPGFIDIQFNGGFGFDFSTIADSDEEYVKGLREVSKKLLSHGVTSFAPTLITSSSETYRKVLPHLYRRNGDAHGAGVLGAHLEGPFISKDKVGCHPKHYVSEFGSDPEKKLLEIYGSFENIGIVTLAPEIPGSEEAIKSLVKSNVIVSLGHSSAQTHEGEAGIKAGATCLTHLFNAMRQFHHRDSGLIGLLASPESENIYYGIISDGVHTDDYALRIAHRTCPNGLILITDAMAALGMGDGCHKLGDQNVLVNGLQALLINSNTPAGSVASLPHCIRHFIKITNASIGEALKAATSKPAGLLKLQSKGTLDVGKDADLVILSPDMDVKATFINGQLVYSPEN